MHKESHGNLIASTLEYYRQRTSNSDKQIPEPYKKIKRKLEKTKESGQKVLIDIKDSYSVQTVIVRFEYIHDRWAMRYSTCYLEGEEVQVPYTIHYSDIYCKRMNIKVIIEGENPFG